MHDDELLDLVNDKDEIIDTVWRTQYDPSKDNGRGYIRACEILIQNDVGKFWIPKRTAHKKIAPNGLDYSAGGHVGSGQTYAEATIREVEEELNLTLSEDDLEFVRKFGPSEGLPYFRVLFIYHSNETPQFNPQDFVSAEWLSLDELIDQLDSGVPCKTSLKVTIKSLADQQKGKSYA